MPNKFPPNIRQSPKIPPNPGVPVQSPKDFNAGDAGGQMLKQAMKQQVMKKTRNAIGGQPNGGGRGQGTY